MICQRCDSGEVFYIHIECDDKCCFIKYKDFEKIGYVPFELGIGGGEIFNIKVCLNCGQLQGEFPIDIPKELIQLQTLNCSGTEVKIPANIEKSCKVIMCV